MSLYTFVELPINALNLLKDRTQNGEVESSLSSSRNLPFGVPQG